MTTTGGPMAGSARFDLVALDCPDPAALADFHAARTGHPFCLVRAGAS